VIRHAVCIPWDPRIPPRFRLDRPESQLAIDAMVELLDVCRAGGEPSQAQQFRWLKVIRRAAYADRQRKQSYAFGSDSVGDIRRMEVALVGALRYAAVLVELRDARLRNRPAGINHNDRP
jgi:hypothetical protein